MELMLDLGKILVIFYDKLELVPGAKTKMQKLNLEVTRGNASSSQ